MTLIHHAKGALLAGLLLGAAPFLCSAQDYNPVAKTTAAPGGATPPQSPTDSYQTQMSSSTPPAAATAPAADPQTGQIGHGDRSSLTRSDRHFVKEASQGGLYEVRTGKYAAQNGQSYAVRRLGRHMAADHGRLGDQLASLAQAKGLPVMAEPNKLTQYKIDQITGTPAPRFDAVYVNLLVDAHKKDIAAFEKEAQGGSDPDLRNFAATALPTLRHHLMMLQEAQANLK